tara:strand:+ start:354 stop:623 length:270 start_codon:yes stop_codon:yes gene_type:complete
MTLINRRHQRVVGQGFFHTAKLEAEDGRKLRYVYDCGAMKKYETQHCSIVSPIAATSSKPAMAAIASRPAPKQRRKRERRQQHRRHDNA